MRRLMSAFAPTRRPHGAIAQLGERVVRNDEVGGSIPPGSTSLRRLRLLRLGKPPRSEGCPAIARRATADLGKLRFRRSPPHPPVNLGARFSIKLATPSLKSLPLSAICISLFASIVASASVWNG